MPSTATSRARTKPAPPPAGRWQGSGLAQSAQRERKRRAILEAAAKAFTEHGYHETSLADLAERLNVTKPTLYYYVSSKEAMLVEIARGALSDAEARLARSRAETSSALEALRAFARFYVDGMTTDVGRCLLAVRHTRLAPATQRAMNVRFKRIDTMVRALVDEGIAEGTIRDCDARLATFAFFGAMNWVPHWYDARGALGTAATADALFEVFAHGFAAGRGGRRTP